MTKLPSIDARALERALRKLGFVRDRQKGSHVVFKHPDGRWTTVPFHLRKDIPEGLLRQIIKNIEMTPDDFKTFLSNRT